MAPVERQRGALLVEALVAIAVFSLGVLGNVALHAQAMRHVGEAHYRSEAALLAQSLLARMAAEDAALLAARYAEGRGGYDDFAALARRLPGAQLSGNAPEVRVEAGPSAASRSVSVVVRWQSPGEAAPHRHAVSAVVGGN